MAHTVSLLLVSENGCYALQICGYGFSIASVYFDNSNATMHLF